MTLPVIKKSDFSVMKLPLMIVILILKMTTEITEENTDYHYMLSLELANSPIHVFFKAH